MAGITAKMIAEQLGVSQAAVSIALNGKSGVSAETRAQILAYAEKMGYNAAKLAAVRAQRKRLCFVFYVNRLVSIAENTTFSSFVLKGAEAAASAMDYSISVRYFRAGEPFADQLNSQLSDIDGIILLGTDITDGSVREVRNFLDRIYPVPVVIIDSYENFGIADCICNDNFGGAKQAVEYLIGRGCRDVGYLRSKHRIDNFCQREAGVRAALREAGMHLNTVVDTEVSFDDAYNGIERYISMSDNIPDAFFAENDVIAAAAIRAFNAHNIKVPEQVSLIGFDDLPICELTAPYLTTVHSFKEQLGEAAVKILSMKFMPDSAETVPEKQSCMTIHLSMQLHIRDSVK